MLLNSQRIPDEEKKVAVPLSVVCVCPHPSSLYLTVEIAKRT